MHARGLGDEVPWVVTAERMAMISSTFQAGGPAWFSFLKPRAARDGVPTAQVGDMVVVEAQGASPPRTRPRWRSRICAIAGENGLAFRTEP